MTTPLGPTTGTATTSSGATLGPTLGKEDFLKLLVTQLRNQDPLSPMDGSEFAAQLAQFSTVEQLIEIGAKLDDQAANIAQGALTTQTMLGSSLIGRQVMLRGTTLATDGVEAPRVAVDLAGPARHVIIEVLDAQGGVLDTQTFDDVAGGRAVLDLDGVGLPAGQYNYRVSASAADGSAVTATGYTVGLVEGMSFTGGEVALRIDGTLVPMLDILEVLSADPPSGRTTSTAGAPTP
jgi:flagellar basal-body rod modification protein FlgD